MLYKDLFIGDKGVFVNVFKKDFPEHYAVIFGETLPQVYDTLAILKYGGKTLYGYITDDNCVDVVRSVITSNVDNWVLAAKAMTAKYDVAKPVSRETSRTEKVDDTETSADISTNSQKAFNDTDFTPDSKGQSDLTKDRASTRTITESVTGYGDGVISDKLKKEFQFRLDNWRENIIFAIIKELTLSIY